MFVFPLGLSSGCVLGARGDGSRRDALRRSSKSWPSPLYRLQAASEELLTLRP